jgi:hypothetical protein
MKSSEKVPVAKNRAELRHISKSISNARTLINNMSAESQKVQEKPIVFMDFSINGEMQKRVRFKLYYDQVPLTAENFRQLCCHQKV